MAGHDRGRKAPGKGGGRASGSRGRSTLGAARANEADANRACRDHWQLYGEHRQRLTAAIVAEAPAVLHALDG